MFPAISQALYSGKPALLNRHYTEGPLRYCCSLQNSVQYTKINVALTTPPTTATSLMFLFWHPSPAVRQVRAGVGFGAAEHSVKALQIALSDNGLGGKPDEHGKLPGYKISFNFSRPPRPPGSGHPNSGSARGMYLAAHGPPEANKKDDHDEDCCERFGGLGKCPQLAGVDIVTLPRGEIVSHGKVGKKHQHPPAVEGVALDTHAFATGLMGELENASINRRTCDLAVVDAPGHSKNRLAVCCAEVWECGRCFCATPLMRSFDALGRLRLTRL